MSGFVLPQSETLHPCAAERDSDVAHIMDVIVRDAVFTALPYFNRRRSPEICCRVVDVIALDDVLPVDIRGARLIAAQADAAAASAGDLIVNDAVLHRGVVQLDPISRQPDEPAILDRAIRRPIEENRRIRGAEM